MRWDSETGRWVPRSSDAASTASDGGSPFRVTEDTVLLIWEKSSRRRMTAEETRQARGHPLVSYLRSFFEADLTSAATSVNSEGSDLDWRKWRDAVQALESRRPSQARKSTRAAPNPNKRRSRKQATDKKISRKGGTRKSGSRFTNPDDTREIQTGA